MKRVLPWVAAGLVVLILVAVILLPSQRKNEFEVYAEKIRNSHNPYFGTLQIPELLKQLESKDPIEVFRAHAQLGRHYMRFAEIDKAVERFEKALAMASGPSDRALVLMQLATAHLKQGELENCVAMHGPESCIYPLSAQAQHQNRRGSQAAIARLMELLELQPDNAHARWLLNVAHMTLGTKPPDRFAMPVPPSEYDPGRFRNVAPQAGITAMNHAGGAVMDDFDGDGFLDIVTTDCDPSGPMHFWHNNGDGTFADRPIPGQLGGLNLIHGDFDNDGKLDLLVLRGGWMGEDGHIRVSLLRNLGDGKFEDVTRQVGLAEPANPTQTAAWADIDGDGDLDLFIGSENYPCRLYRNDNGKFVDITKEAGVENGGCTKGCAWGDYDNDGKPDLYVSNFGQPNRLYHNLGGGKFVDVAAELGVTEPIHSFGCWWFDYDNDGWLDLLVLGYGTDSSEVSKDMLGQESQGERPRLYHNVHGKFVDVTKEMGLWHVWLPMGANFGDLDNDGLLDIYLGTGRPTYDAIFPNVMLRNAGTKFQDVTVAGGFGHLQKGHGVAWGDVNNDGHQDVFIQIGGFYPGDAFRNALFMNPGNGNHWLIVRLVGVRANRFGVGARIAVTTEKRTIHRMVSSGGSFGGNPFQQHIGLGQEHAQKLEIVWPGSGTRQVFTQVPTDACVEAREGDADLHTIQRPR